MLLSGSSVGGIISILERFYRHRDFGWFWRPVDGLCRRAMGAERTRRYGRPAV